MKADPLNILVVVLFFILGFLLENYLSFPSSEIGSVTEIISAFCTVAAVVVGALALRTWEKQFKYQERYKNIVVLEASFNNVMFLFYRYRYKFLECARNGVPTGKLYGELDEFKSYQEVFFKYRQQWNATTFALEEKTVEQFEFKPDQLHGTLMQFLKPVIDKYNYETEQKIVGDNLVGDNLILNFDKEFEMLSKKIVGKIRTLNI
jgi:hypothetical protein